jgi:glycosyltransferase involved in cell wall biosynthesis
MRLLIVTDAWRPQVNGVVRTYEWLSSALSKRVHLNMLTPEPFFRAPLPTYPEIEIALAPPWRVAKLIESAAPDIVHIGTEGPLGFLARRYCRRHRIPFTTCYHTRYPEYIARRLPVPLSWTYAALRNFHSGAARTLVASRELADELKQKGFGKVIPWRRGVDTDLFRSGLDEKLDLPRPVFLYVGRLAVEKNIDDFLSLDLPGSKVVIGDGPERMRLQRAYPEAHFFGAIEGPRLGALYRAADVFVFPSRTDTYGLVMVEALAAGVPVACYPTSGAREIFGGEACGVMSESLQDAALSALAIPRDNCRRVGERHALDASVENFLQIMQSAIQRPNEELAWP